MYLKWFHILIRTIEPYEFFLCYSTYRYVKNIYYWNPGHLTNAHLVNGHLANGHLANKCMGGHLANRQF